MSSQRPERISNNHRSRLDIIADILEASQNGVKKTYLMYRCNLSFRQLKSYLLLMVGRELLFTVSEDGFSSSDLFKITDKGRKFLRVYDGLQSLME